MEFCEVCRNMLYLRTDDEDVLIKHCRSCRWERPYDGRAFRVAQTSYAEDDMLYVQHQNPYLRFDPTLPRICDTSVQCPNAGCTGPRDKPQVLYVKYHPVNMLYLYCCDHCGHCDKSEAFFVGAAAKEKKGA
jgi:DNA-directed RNA polymerase subunit M/transcription elongation factor TFIIS